jgi:hypothetical protein
MLADIDGKIYLEVHRDIYKKAPDAQAQFDHLLRALNLASKVDRVLAADIIREQGGIVREIGRKILDENK